MAFEYLPVMARNSAPKTPRILATVTRPEWQPAVKGIGDARVALLSSAALRMNDQAPFVPRDDVSYRKIPSRPNAGAVIIDHHSGIGGDPKRDPEIVFPRNALADLAGSGAIGGLAPFHLSFMGGVREHEAVQNELAPALARELIDAQVDLALLVPY